MKVRKGLMAMLAGGYLTLWVGGVGSHLLFGYTSSDAAWAAPTFLALAGLLVLLTAEDRRQRAALLAVGALGTVIEALGVHSGFPFGRYAYTDVLQPQIAGVPLVMAAAWLALAAYVCAMLASFRLAAWRAVVFAGLWMTAIDLVIDPLAAGALNYWRWAETGSYYGIPTQNFFGWLVMSWLLFGIVARINTRPWPASPWPRAIGLSIILFFTLIAAAHHLLMVAGIGLGLCLIHLAIAHHQQKRVRAVISISASR